MKKTRVASAGIAFVLAITFLLHAQTAALQSIQSASADSVVAIVAEDQGLTLTTDLPKGGTYWTFLPGSNLRPRLMPPMPCPPSDLTLNVYSLGVPGQFLVDGGSGGNASAAVGSLLRQRGAAATPTAIVQSEVDEIMNLITQVQDAQVNQELNAMSGMDGEMSPLFLGSQSATNDLWLSILGKTNTTAYLAIHPPWNVTNGVWDLLFTTNLSPPVVWSRLMRSAPGQTNLIVSGLASSQGFFRLGVPNDPPDAAAGTNFWTVFPGSSTYLGPGAYDLSLMISGQHQTTGTVSIAGLGFTTNFSVTPGVMTSVEIPADEADMGYYDAETYGTIMTNGVHITSGQPVSVQGFYWDEFASEAFTAYPAPMLGTNYCIMGYMGWGAYGDEGDNEFAVVATKNNTTITVVPSPTAYIPGHTNGVPFSTNLQAGETYELQSGFSQDGLVPGDMTGTFVRSDQPIAVVAGSSLEFTPSIGGYGYANPLFEEQFPISTWGRQVLGLPLANHDGMTYRVLAASNNTDVTVNGTWVTNLNAGQFYDIAMLAPVNIRASAPIQVAEFSHGNYYDNTVVRLLTGDGSYIGTGDPFEMLLQPTDHYLNAYTVCSPSQFCTNYYMDVVQWSDDSVATGGEPYAEPTNYLNIIVEPSAITSTFVDGQPVPAASFNPVGDSGYYGAQVGVTNGAAHIVISSKPMGVQAYGLAYQDGYGYIGGEANVSLAAVPDFTNNVPMNTPATMDVLANDLFSNRNDVVLTILNPPAHGTAVANSSRNVIYTPTSSFTGLDQFDYQIVENGNTNSATVTIGVVSQPPVATNFIVTSSPGDPVTTNALTQAFSPVDYSLNVASVGPPTYGQAIINPDGTITYLVAQDLTYAFYFWPVGGFIDSFTYTVSDEHGGTATGTITVDVTQ